MEQVDLVSKENCVVGKGDKQRLVYINDKIVHAIREYLKERRSESPYLFVSRQSGKLSPSRINQIFNQYAGEWVFIHEIANQAGHSNVQTTLIYSNSTAKEMKEKANRL